MWYVACKRPVPVPPSRTGVYRPLMLPLRQPMRDNSTFTMPKKDKNKNFFVDLGKTRRSPKSAGDEATQIVTDDLVYWSNTAEPGGEWRDTYREATAFKSKRSAEKAAFSLTTGFPYLIGHVSVTQKSASKRRA